ncbi:hypothetical protein KUTeg_000930 [Tegillarca granosa]|uniref:Alpha-galactosidase n=1 Tax=Tegillarca granosa TaxID=220873 RepID=A0ABQ9FWA2_TEGGR|nr:hypothetical protein KUTeg_000930 [Tegillarca granosa]
MSVVADRCDYLRSINWYHNLGFDIVYLDETWVNQNHTSKYTWISNTPHELNPVAPPGKGQRFVMLHAACTRTGLIPCCDLVFKANSSDGDYDKEMNGDCYLHWFEHQLLPGFNNPQTKESIAPNSNTLKADMIKWLNDNNIAFPNNALKPEIYQIIKRNKPKPIYKTDVMTELHGHVVLRLPERQCETFMEQ